MKQKTSRAVTAVLLCCLFLLPWAPSAFAAILYGDVNFDNTVTAEDARLVLRAAVGLETFTSAQRLYGDIDSDGAVTASDARLTLRIAVGLPLDNDDPAPPTDPEPPADPEPPTQPAPTPGPTKEERQAAWLAAFPDAVSYDDLDSNMRWLVNDLGVRSWWNSTQNAVGNLLFDRLGAYGYTGTQRQIRDFYYNGILGRNVLAVIPTAVQNPKILLVIAHYDTARTTGGAVDNSSGTAALLQLAKRFKATGEDYGLEIRFLFTAGEEQGYYGAYAYVNALSYEEKSRHILAFNMDMAGRPASANYVLAVSTEPVSTDGYYAPGAVANVGSRALDAAREALPDIWGYGYYSAIRAGVHDIVPFRKAGMTALTLSWRTIDYSRSSGADYGLASAPFIHTWDDNIANFDMDSLYRTTRLAAGAVARLVLPYTALA